MTTPPTATKIRECKYQCRTILSDFDEEAHKYKEYETGIIHTIERCQAAKERLIAVKQLEQQKNDHGNESYPTTPTKGPDFVAPKTEYVDHTLARPSKCKIFFGNFAPDVEKDYEEFQRGKRFSWARAQSHVTPQDDPEGQVLFTIFLYYEEAPL